jgi:hypothetical protein
MAPLVPTHQGMMTIDKKFLSILFLISVFLVASCRHSAEVHHPDLVRSGRFVYLQDPSGRWIIVARNTRDLDEAMKRISPGPASVDKLDLWIITPLDSGKH